MIRINLFSKSLKAEHVAIRRKNYEDRRRLSPARRKYNEKWKLSHTEERRRYQRQYLDDNPDKRQNEGYWKDYYLKNKKAIANRNDAYHSIPEIALQNLRYRAVYRAKQTDTPFDLEALKTITATLPTNCICCGRVLDCTRRKQTREGLNSSPSIDRIVNEDGYIENNMAIICYRCNNVKGDATIEEIAAVLRYMQKCSR